MPDHSRWWLRKMGEDPYENIVLGNFLVQLGVRIGVKVGKNHLSCDGELLEVINLAVLSLQQTPLDTALADLLLASAKLIRIIEFKRMKSRASKEAAKHVCLSSASDGDANTHLREMSRKIHWYVVSHKDKQYAMPYLDLNKPLPHNSVGMSDLLDGIAEAIFGPPMSDWEKGNAAEYIKRAGIYAGTQLNQTNASAGGLVLIVDADGTARALFIRDIRELLMPLDRVVEMRRSRDMELEKARELELQKERLLGRELGIDDLGL